jgi:flagellin-like protein
MNFRKFRKNAKALSPVIASIILIAVTVAVSVVVAAWMGGISLGFMGNAEQVSIVNIQFTDSTHMSVLVQNTAGSDSNVTVAFIDGKTATVANTLIPKSSSAYVTVTSATAFNAGQAYQLKLITAKGTSVVYSATYSP